MLVGWSASLGSSWTTVYDDIVNNSWGSILVSATLAGRRLATVTPVVVLIVFPLRVYLV